MVNYCCAIGCKEKASKDCSVSFHSFPKEEERRKLWLSKLRRENFTLTNNTKICSKHFTSDSFDREKLGGTWLKKTAVPTLFDFPDHLQPKTKGTNPSRMRMIQNVITPPPETEPLSKKRKYYIGDFQEKDMTSPAKACYVLNMAKNCKESNRLKVKKLSNQNQRLQKRIYSLKEILKEMRKKALISQSASDILEDGNEKFWDLMRVHDSVAIIIYNTTRQKLIFVKQFRPAVYYAEVKNEDCEGEIDVKKYPPSLGLTVELCAGIVDKDQSLVETARDEVFEECGYSVPLSMFQKVTSYRSGVGVAGSVQTLYYVEVADSMKVTSGGGNSHEGEYIEVIEMDLPEAQSLIYDETAPRPPSLLVALMWFFQNKASGRLCQKL